MGKCMRMQTVFSIHGIYVLLPTLAERSSGQCFFRQVSVYSSRANGPGAAEFPCSYAKLSTLDTTPMKNRFTGRQKVAAINHWILTRFRCIVSVLHTQAWAWGNGDGIHLEARREEYTRYPKN